MNNMLTTLGTQAEFHQTWQALMQQLETLLSIAHMRHPTGGHWEVVGDEKLEK